MYEFSSGFMEQNVTSENGELYLAISSLTILQEKEEKKMMSVWSVEKELQIKASGWKKKFNRDARK